MKSVMQHQFSEVPRVEIQRSSFDRTHGYKTAFDAGYLVPFLVDEALPGDTFSVNVTGFARMATPVKPIMDNLFMSTFFFAVPCRLVWDNWQKFNGEQRNPGDSTSYLVPIMTSPAVTGYAENSLSDYFGLPVGVPGLVHNSLHHRAYNLIWNEWFRDENLQNSVTVDVDDGPDDPADYVLLRRNKRHDYFTSCLPWPQKGTAVDLPLGTSAPVLGIGKLGQGYPLVNQTVYESDLTTTVYPNSTAVDGDGGDFLVRGTAATGGYPDVYADLASATASTINQLRQAFQIQKLYERDARGGTRYVEILKSHFGVTSPDARLQRPEFLGGGRTPVNVNPIAQTNATGATGTPQGNLSAMGTVYFGGHGFTKSFTEHCLIIGLVTVNADLTYQQGMDRMWSRQTRWDYYWPALAHIGEQAVLNKEIYADASANDDLVFGYQERYAEYRYKPSKITGVFRSSAAASLDVWHLSQDFSALPALNSSFIQDDPPIDRVIAVPAEPHFLFDSFIRMKCARPMPVFGVPGLIDHF